MSGRPEKTILGNALKWALLMPLAVIVAGIVAVFVFAAGFGFASFFTDDMHIRSFAGLITMVMGLGAVMGASTA